MKSIALTSFLILTAVLAGYALQEETGICLPEVHADHPCHCLDMGGYQLCHDGKPFSYQEWAQENQRRSGDIDPKTKKQKQPDIPMCTMSCKEENCDCCGYMDRLKKKKAAITIPYDPI